MPEKTNGYIAKELPQHVCYLWAGTIMVQSSLLPSISMAHYVRYCEGEPRPVFETSFSPNNKSCSFVINREAIALWGCFAVVGLEGTRLTSPLHPPLLTANRTYRVQRRTVRIMTHVSRQVPYKREGSQVASWVPVSQRLQQERIIMVGKFIDEEYANRVRLISLRYDSIHQLWVQVFGMFRFATDLESILVHAATPFGDASTPGPCKYSVSDTHVLREFVNSSRKRAALDVWASSAVE